MDTNQPFDEGKRELPGMLNVLTILTFIGCALSYITTLYGFFTAGTGMEDLEEAVDKAGDNEMMRKLAEGSIEMAEKSADNKYILLISGLLFTTLCLIGALQMRKLKKSGYLLYVIGELTPVIISAAIFGFGSLMGNIGLIAGAFFALLFVILYTTQRKYLVNN
jgi:hypothetical protein